MCYKRGACWHKDDQVAPSPSCAHFKTLKSGGPEFAAVHLKDEGESQRHPCYLEYTELPRMHPEPLPLVNEEGPESGAHINYTAQRVLVRIK